MKRFLIFTSFLTALVGCQSVDSNVTDPSAEAHGRETFKAIEFTIRDTSATKAPTPITSLSEFNVSATSGSAGSEASKLSNVVFTSSNGVFKSDAVWPSSDPGYHFYASNVAMTHTASGQTVKILTIDKDVVCAYLASPAYKVKNDLVFNHILARVGKVSFTNLSLCSNVRLSMKYSGSGTYNIRTGAWSGVGGQSTKELSTNDNNFWIIPGTYDATLTYTDANGNPQSKTINQEFKAGKVNNISAKLDGSVVVKTEDEYEAPTFTLGTITDVPAGGGDSGTPSVTAVGQRKRVKKTFADGTVKYDDWTAVSSPDYTIQYGKTLTSLLDNCPSYHGNNLGTTAKARTKLGDVYVRVKIGDKTTDKPLEVYQQANEETLGTLAVKSFSYSPKVGAAGGTASPSVSYELPYSWTSGASGKYTTNATLSYITVTDNADATLNASTGVVIWAANSGNERSEKEKVTVSLKGKSNTAEAVSTQSGDSVDYYDAPTGLSISCSDIPASGGTKSEGTVSGTAKQVVHYKSGATTTIDVSVSKSWSTAVSASNLQKTVKSRTKVGTLTLTYSANDKSNTASCDVYQAKNERHTGSTSTKDHTRTGSVSYDRKEYYGDIKWGNKEYGSEYYKNTTTDSEVQDADTFGEWETTGTSTYKYNYAVSFASTSWSPGAVGTSKSNSVTAYHYERDKYEQRRPVTHHYHTPYTDHYYKDWTRTNSRSYTCSASQNCNYIEYRTDTFDSGATEYVEENKSHTETWTASGTESNYSTDRGSDWSRDASGSTSRTSDGGYDYQTTYGSGSKVTDYPTPTSNRTWLTYSGGTMSVSSNSSTSSRYGTLSVSNGPASASCSVSQGKNQQTGSSKETETDDSGSRTSDTDYWVMINGSTGSSVDVSADAGSVAVNVTAGHKHTVQPQIKTRTRTKYTWEVGDPTYGSWSSWSGWSDYGDPTVTYPSDTPALSSDKTWLSTNGSYSANTSTSSSRSAKITAAVKVSYSTKASATLTVNQAKKELTLSSIAISVTSSSILAGQKTSYKVTATYSDKSTADITSSATVTSSNSSMLSASGGSVQSNKKIGCLGTFTLTADYSGKTATCTITVNTDYKSDDIKLSWSSDVGRSGEASSGTVSGYVKRNYDSQVTVSFKGNLKTSNNDTYSASNGLIEFYCDGRKASTSQTYCSQDGDRETYEMRYLGEVIKSWSIRWDGQ